MNRTAKRHQKKLARKAALKQPGGGAAARSLSLLLGQGVEHHRAGRAAQAEAVYRQILALDPDHAEANHLLGVLAHQHGQLDRAADLMAKAIARRPGYAEAHNNLGNLLRDQGRRGAAAAAYDQALAIDPGFAMAHSNRGNLFKDQGRLGDAAEAYGRALAIEPDFCEAHNNLGLALHGMGRLSAAAAALRKAVALKPDYGAAYSNLGLVLHDQGALDEAMAAYGTALALDPALAEAHGNLGLALQDQGRLGPAAASITKALELRPDRAELHNNLGALRKNQGRLVEAVAGFAKAVELDPGDAAAHSNLIFCMNCDAGFTQADIYAESRRWEAAHAAPGAARAAPDDPDPDRRLRIGYVSPDFKRHSVGRFLAPLMAHHDRRRFEIHGYAEVVNPDAETRRFEDLADGWCSTVGMTTPALAARIRADRIDILVDLAGHTADSRLAAFAGHPAPVQLAWLGYPNTTGLSAMDYRLSDAIADPPGPGDALHSEELIRLAGGFLCFDAGLETPPVAAAPARASGAVTFGSFNNLAKVTETTVDAWARILAGAPDSRLLLKNRSLADPETRERYRALFAARGVAGERLEFLAWIESPAGHLGAYERIDIALDPFPYNGTTTTCEALWMGVPVITLRGDRHAGRVGASLLTTLGQEALIAETVDGYVAAAVGLAADLGRLVHLRHSLRPAMAASPLTDAAGFTRRVEAAYRDMWRRYCVNS
jgi:predicted O-linked N-acetylglucosamine transferase (SPINDLY family)